eukprot:Skav232935  [mRNA]  locus=scaffold1477:1147710:1150734:- [translate_table: standard]
MLELTEKLLRRRKLLCETRSLKVYARNRHASLVVDQCLETLATNPKLSAERCWDVLMARRRSDGRSAGRGKHLGVLAHRAGGLLVVGGHDSLPAASVHHPVTGPVWELHRAARDRGMPWRGGWGINGYGWLQMAMVTVNDSVEGKP